MMLTNHWQSIELWQYQLQTQTVLCIEMDVLQNQTLSKSLEKKQHPQISCSQMVYCLLTSNEVSQA